MFHNLHRPLLKRQQVMSENERTEQQTKQAGEVKMLDFRVWVTSEQMQALKDFLLQNHIRYGRVK